MTSDGEIVTVAGTGERGWSGDGGPALAAKLNEPYEVRCDAAGNVFWVERLSHCVRKLDTKTGIVATIAGNGTAGFSGDAGLATKAQLNDPHSIGFDKSGDLYICDVKNHRIRKVDLKSGEISTFAGTGERKPTIDGARFAESPLYGPRALDFDRDGNPWLALREGNAIYKLDLAQGTVHHIAGTGRIGFAGNGSPAKEATLNGPKGLSNAPYFWPDPAQSNGLPYIRCDGERNPANRTTDRRNLGEMITATGTTCRLQRSRCSRPT